MKPNQIIITCNVKIKGAIGLQIDRDLWEAKSEEDKIDLIEDVMTDVANFLTHNHIDMDVDKDSNAEPNFFAAELDTDQGEIDLTKIEIHDPIDPSDA